MGSALDIGHFLVRKKIDPDDYIWAVDSGRHTLRKYEAGGDVLHKWRQVSARLEGFSGCCNPSHIVILEDGTVVYSAGEITEKKLALAGKQMDEIKIAQVEATTELNENLELRQTIAQEKIATAQEKLGLCDLSLIAESYASLVAKKQIVNRKSKK